MWQTEYFIKLLPTAERRKQTRCKCRLIDAVFNVAQWRVGNFPLKCWVRVHQHYTISTHSVMNI